MPNGPMYQARTHNHLTWVMVDATDFATPESGLSGAKIMVNAKLQSTSLLYFVSSGTGSMAGGDIKHVGASATGVYTVNLVKADLSDASAAWYDQYIFTITGTGAAQQVIVCEGVLAKNTISNISDYLSKMSDVLSNAYSAAGQGTSKLVKVYSMLSDTLSTMNSQFAVTSNYLSNASNYLSNISALASDIDSAMTSQFTIVASRVKGNSDYLSKMSDVLSNAYSAAAQATSQILLTKTQATAAASRASDIRSRMDSASYLSDIASHVWTAKYTGLSAASSFGSLFSDVYSRLVKTQSNALAGASRAVLLQSSVSSVSNLLSDVDSALTSHLTIVNQINSRVSDMRSRMDSASFMSDIASHVWTAKYTGLSAASSFGSLLSDMNSRIKGNSDFLSKMSDVWSNTQAVAVQTNSRVKGNSDFLSKMSDAISDAQIFATAGASRATKIYSMLSDTLSTMTSQYSDVRSAVGAITVTIGASEVSDIASAVLAGMTGVSASDIKNIAAKVWSDFGSQVGRTPSDVFSDLLNAASDTYSAVNVANSRIKGNSDYLSKMSDILSNAYSAAAQASSRASDIRSRMDSASYLSDIASHVWAAKYTANSAASSFGSLLSDIGSRVKGNSDYLSKMSDVLSNAYSAAAQGTSQILLTKTQATAAASRASDIRSRMDSASYLSDIASHVWAAKYTANSAASSFGSLLSDMNSRIKGNSDFLSKMSDAISDAQIFATAAASRATKIYSMLSDTQSTMGSQYSDIKSAVTTIGSDVLSQLSDIRSAVGNITVNLTASDISDIASAVAAAATGVTPSDIKNIAVKVWSDFQSKVGRSVSDVMSDILNEVSDLSSNVRKIPKTDSDLTFNATAVGNIKAGLATQSNLDSAATQIDSNLSDLLSTVGSQFAVLQSRATLANSRLLVNQSTASNIYELLSDVDSALTSQLAKEMSQFTKINSNLSDFHSDFQSQFVKTNSQLNVNVITVNDTYSLLSSLNSDFGVGVPVSLPAAIGTGISDIYSLLSDFKSDFGSRVPKLVATASQVSDLSSDVKSAVTTIGSDVLSHLDSITSAMAGGLTGDDIADALLDRDLGAGSDTGNATKRTPRQALRFLRNKWTISGAVLSVKKENDTDESWNASLTTTPGASPVTGTDPES